MKFTIGIPAYKGRFLAECMQSVLDQTIDDFEVIVVNDRSPDNVKSIVECFNSPKIKYYENDSNIGSENPILNWNKCLDLAKGDYFVLLGDDDKLAADFLEAFSLIIERFPQCLVFHARSKIINERSEIIDVTETRPELESVYDSIWQRINGYRRFFISDYVFNTEKLKQEGGFYPLPLAWGSDDITSYIATCAAGIAHTNNPVFMYRQNRLSISSTGSVEKKLLALNAQYKWLDLFLERKPDDEIDNILRNKIIVNLPRIRFKHRYFVLSSLGKNIPSLLWEALKLQSEIKINLKELMFACMLKIKSRAAK